MKHIILGSGRLGKALFKVLSADKEDQTVMYHMRSSGLTSPERVKSLLVRHGLEDAVVWNCIGAGSIKEGKEDPETMVNAHVIIPMAINEIVHIAKAKAIHFSSDYALQPELSFYAKSKKQLEDHCSKDAIVIRVANLYDAQDPSNSIFGRLVKNYLSDTSTPILVSDNYLYPTEVNWLAAYLVWTNVWDLPNGIYKAIPAGAPAREVATTILPQGAVGFAPSLDLERPMIYEETEPYHYAKDLLPRGNMFHWHSMLNNNLPDAYNKILVKLHMESLYMDVSESTVAPKDIEAGQPQYDNSAMFT